MSEDALHIETPNGADTANSASQDGANSTDTSTDAKGEGSSPGGNGGLSFDEIIEDLANRDEAASTWLAKNAERYSRDKNGVVNLITDAYQKDRIIGNGAIKVPGKEASDDEWNAFYDKIGRPEKADGYEFDVPNDLPETLPYDAEQAAAFKAEAHKIGLTKRQAQQVHDLYVRKRVEEVNGMRDQMLVDTSRKAEATATYLQQLWGPLDGTEAKQKLAAADKFLQVSAGNQYDDVIKVYQKAGLIAPDGKTITEPLLAVMFARAGEAFAFEDDAVTGDPDVLMDGNPFARTDGTGLDQVTKLIKTNPKRAAELARQAGKDPKRYGLKD